MKQGKIYKLTSASTNLIYIGSTCMTLNKRLSGHKYSFKKNDRLTTSKQIMKYNDAQIILIEDVVFNDKTQLYTREKHHIDLNKNIVVNKQMPTRTLAESCKNWRSNNVEYLKEYERTRNIPVKCECGLSYIKRKKARHDNTKIHKKYMSINEILVKHIYDNKQIDDEFELIEIEYNQTLKSLINYS